MTEINGLGGKIPDWSVLLNNIQNAGDTQNVGGNRKANDNNLVLSEGEGGSQVHNPSTPSIETPKPEGYTDEEIDSIINKLGTNVFNFSGEDLQAFNEALRGTVEKLLNGVQEKQNEQLGGAQGGQETQGTQGGQETQGTQGGQETQGTQGGQEAQGTQGGQETQGTQGGQETQETQGGQETQGTQGGTQTTPTVKASSTKVLFDVYQALALLIECAQSLKNSERDIRQAENAQVINSIQNQADAQRSAALTGMIAGGIVCLISVGASIYSAAKTISNVKAESNINTQFGVQEAAHEVNTAQTELNNARAELKTFNEAHPKPAEGADPDAVARGQLQTRVDNAKTTLMEKKVSFESKITDMKNSDQFQALQKSQAWTKGFSEISMAIGNLGQTVVRGGADLAMASATAKGADEKKAEEEVAQTKDLMSSFQDVIAQALQLLQAVQQAENQSMHEAIQA